LTLPDSICLVAHDVDLAAQQVVHGRRGALVGHGRHVDLHGRLEQQAAQVRGRADARIGQVDLALVGLHPLGKLGVVVGRQVGPADQRHRHFVDHAEVFEVVQRLVGQRAVQRRCAGDADVVQQQRVAIRRGLGDLVGAQRAADAADVLDDDGAAQRLAQRFGEVPGDLVGRAPGGEGHDERDGFVGVFGQCGKGNNGGQEARGERQGCAHQEVSIG
jgi:hypothetical protein